MFWKSGHSINSIYKDDYHNSRVLFIFEACAGGTIFNLTTGAFLAGLAVHMGASDWFNGLLGVVPMIAGTAQFFSPLILEGLKERKGVVVFFSALYKLLISSVVFIPFLISNQNWRLIAFLICVVIAYSGLNLVWPGFSMWLTGVIPEDGRGRYFGLKDTYSITVITIITLLMGFVLDAYKKPGSDKPEYTGFLVVFLVALGLAVANIFILLKIKGPRYEPARTKIRLLDCFIKPLGDKKYLKVVLFFILWNIGLNIGASFLPLYQVKYLKLDYTYIMLLNVISNVTMVLMVSRWGRMADRLTWAHTSALSIGLLSITHFMWVFVTGNSLYLLPVVFIMNGIAWSGVNISLFNLPFLFIPDQNKTIYLGFNAAVGGVSGLISALFAAWLVNYTSGMILNIGIFNFSNIQLVVFVSSLILAGCASYGFKTLYGLVAENH